jgi:hypothetical protein
MGLFSRKNKGVEVTDVVFISDEDWFKKNTVTGH